MTFRFLLFSFSILMVLGSCKSKEFIPYYPSSEQKRIINTESLKKMSREVKARNLKGIYRQVSKNDSGKISICVCIDPIGKVVYAEIIEDRTTISSNKIKKAYLEAATGYRFERDRNAPPEECGIIKFELKNNFKKRDGFEELRRRSTTIYN